MERRQLFTRQFSFSLLFNDTVHQNMKAQSRKNNCLLIVISLCLASQVQVVSAKTTYYMDKSADCGIGAYDVEQDREITIYAKDPNSPGSTQGACTMNFRAVDVDATLTLDFIVFSVSACNKVSLYLSGDATGSSKSFGCGDSPDTYNTIDRSITITLHKTDITNQNYNFQLRLRAIRENQFPPPGDSNPAAVGLVIGIVGGVFGFIIIVSIIGICCFRKYRVRGPTKSPYMYDSSSKTKLEENQSHMSVGYANENLHGSPMSKRKLLAPSDSSDDRSEHGSGNRSKMSNYRSNGKMGHVPPPPDLKDSAMIPSRNGYDQTKDSLEKSGTGKYDERGVDVSAQPRNPMLNALKSNSKFKDTFEQTEREAEERVKRISSSSSFEILGVAPTPPDSNENLSRPKLPPVPKSPTSKTRQKTAKIGRNPRSNSFSSDELKKLEKGAEESDNDTNIKVIHDSSTASSTEIVPIKVSEKPKKADTSHTLKPDRKGKKVGRNRSVSSAFEVDEPRPSPRGGRNQSVSSALDEPRSSPRAPREKERVQAFEREFNDNASQNGSGRYSKRYGRKSPRPKGRSSGGKGFSHRRGRSADPYDSRPTTPTYYGSIEDLESLPPLQRTGSKNSLYASRSSLYDRRGRRRKGSYSESVASYGTARDDISVGRHSQIYDSCSDEDDFDGYEKPLSRRDRERMYRSENDLGRRGMKEISTQTLRETATQTGPNESVVMQPKMLVKKRKRSKSLSTAGTQTASKKSEEGKSKKKGDKESNTQTDDETRKKRKSRRTRSTGGSEGTLKGKRSKSLDMLGVDDNGKPKIKPKPVPRKSTSALKENVTGSTENLNNPSQADNPYYPQSEGFAPNYHPQGYPMVPPPGYPGPPSQYPYPVNNGVPSYPPNSLPQQPPMMNGTIQPVPRGPKKSNWEILCELTDGKHKDDPMEVGSIASSVFTNTPANYPGYPAQTFNQPYYNNQGYYPPPPSQPQYYPGPAPQQFSHYPQANMRAQSVPDFMHDLSMSTSSDDTQEKQEKRQATIDSLKEQAKQVKETGSPKSTRIKPQVPKQNLRTESIV